MDKHDDFPQDKGWTYWANTVINNLTSLDKQVNALAEDVSSIQEKLNTEIQSDRNSISEIKITVGQLQTIAQNLKESIAGLSKLYDSVNQQREDIAKLKVKAGMWGGLSGLISAIGAILVYILTKGIK
jgi:small-conductance mechanosensitive channel